MSRARTEKVRAFLGSIALTLAGSTAGLAQDAVTQAPPWHAVNEEAGKVRDLIGLQELASTFPDSGTIRLRLLNAQWEAGELGALLETLAWLNARGYVFSEVSQSQIPKLVGEDYAERARALLIPEARVVETSEVIATYSADAGLLESVMRFPAGAQISIVPRPQLIATSINNRAAAAWFQTGEHIFFDDYGLDNVSGIVWEPVKRSIWVSSGNIDGSAKTEGAFSGLVRLFYSEDPRERIAMPAGANPSDLTVGQDGTIFASDPIGGGVYLAAPNDTEMQALVPPGTFRSPQGLAASKDGGHLYVSDYRYGIAIIDLESREVSRLTTNLEIILDGVDGMWRYNNELIVVQNGTSPMRIAALELAEDGMSVTGYRLLEQAHSEWTEPLSGNLDGDTLLYVGNGQWDRYVAGEPAQDKAPLPTQIRRLLLD